MKLRPYQEVAIAAVAETWNSGIQRPVLVLATGLGKTIIMSHLVADAFERGYRPVILVHRDELVRQTVEKLLLLKGEFTVGVIQANRHEDKADVVVASVQTLTRRLKPGKRGVDPTRFDLIVTDECHHSSAPTYLAIYDYFGGRDPESGTKMLGVTATLERGDGTELGHVWQRVAYEMGAAEGIREGFLSPYIGAKAKIEGLDLKGVRTQHGDWSDGDLGKRMAPSGAKVAAAILEHGRRADGTLRRGICFTPTIECAESWCEAFNDAGIVSRVVIGETPHDVRQAIYRGTSHGVLDMIVSVMCLTEGFDLPAVEMAVIGRPTKKPGLYIQMVGRALRKSKETGKQNALILDVCGVMKDEAICALDLDMPEACQCECACEFTYLCKIDCPCPIRFISGTEGPFTVNHADACEHQCRKGGEWFESSGDPAPSEDAEIEFRTAKLLGEARTRVGKKNLKWLTTKAGTPFLPSNGGRNPKSVFLHQEDDGTWSVGSVGDGGRPTRHGNHLEPVLAMEEAIGIYGPKPTPLAGRITVGQAGVLLANGIEVDDGMSKQEASELISVLFVSKRLD